MQVVALIPAYNEEKTIAQTVEAALHIAGVSQVLVVDDGSTDATAARANKAGATVVKSPRNRGKGAALELGVEALGGGAAAGDALPGPPPGVEALDGGAEEHGLTRQAGALAEALDAWAALDAATQHPDIILLLDADLEATAAQAEPLLAPLLADKAAMAIALPPAPNKKGGFGLVKNLARDAIFKLGDGFEAQAPLSGQRALTWDCLQALRPFAQRYGVEVALTIRALQQGFRVVEVPVATRHRETGRDLQGFIHRGKQYLDVKRALRELRR
ncbi:MAG: glycosyltransferase family 2 protein [Coriobacteriales bacterium]|jgi:glycosyltransferase involved in cell wall biosynthesis|nr:glycosyltransferase family 2 protein [Coriobacteriales bacterium]